VEGGGRGREAAARQCACGRRVERKEREDTGSGWRLRIVESPAGRSRLPGESRQAHEPRQRRQLHAVIRVRGSAPRTPQIHAERGRSVRRPTVLYWRDRLLVGGSG